MSAAALGFAVLAFVFAVIAMLRAEQANELSDSVIDQAQTAQQSIGDDNLPEADAPWTECSAGAETFFAQPGIACSIVIEAGRQILTGLVADGTSNDELDLRIAKTCQARNAGITSAIEDLTDIELNAGLESLC